MVSEMFSRLIISKCHTSKKYKIRYFFLSRNISNSFSETQNKLEYDEEKVKLKVKSMKSYVANLHSQRDNETSYYFENGFRKVYPYYFTFCAFCKERWLGRTVFDVITDEFRAVSENECVRNIETGLIRVNRNVIDVNYKLEHGDLLTHSVHRHEFPVVDHPIKILHVCNDLIVVNKPPSIPVHPCGRFRHNSMTFILGKEFNFRNLKVIHRLDRLASGILILCRTAKQVNRLKHFLKTKKLKKEYICRVEGIFPSEPIVCDNPIKVISPMLGLCQVDESGKYAETEFQRLSTDGTSSVVLCKPITGRTHQIRVHLQYLGYPILNDPFYNTTMFGPEKGKKGTLRNSNEDIIKEFVKVQQQTYSAVLSRAIKLTEQESHLHSELDDVKRHTDEDSESLVNSNQHFGNIGTKLNNHSTSAFNKEPYCVECKLKFPDPKPSETIMYLHACRYTSDDWSFEAEYPKWASANWSEEKVSIEE